jgi:diacylglycerol kinase family enzyme
VARIIAARFRPLTAGVISNGEKQSRFFLMAGAGFDGTVVRGVSPALKKRFGKGAYLLSAMDNLASWESGELTVTTDNQSFTCHSVIVCNAAHYGGSFRLAPGASLFSPAFELLAVNTSSRLGPLALTAEALTGWQSTAITRLTTERLRISGSKPLQADGDYWGDTPVEIIAESNFASIIT